MPKENSFKKTNYVKNSTPSYIPSQLYFDNYSFSDNIATKVFSILIRIWHLLRVR